MKKMSILVVDDIRAALVGVLNSPTRPPALHVLAYIKYPVREIQPQQQPDGTIIVALSKWGYEYKHRGPKPKLPPPDLAAIRAAFNTALSGCFFVRSVLDTQKQIILIMEETQPC